MKKYMIVVFALLILTVSAGAWATIESRTNELTITAGELTAPPVSPLSPWNDALTKLTWTVEYDNITNIFTYKYNFVVPSKAISHLILECSDNFKDAGLPGMYSSEDGSSNPLMPVEIYGTKFEKSTPGVTSNEEGTDWTIQFTSIHAPVWGSFYAKDGSFKDGEPPTQYPVVIYNTGFTQASTLETLVFSSTQDDLNGGAFSIMVAVPDHVDGHGDPIGVVPEASSLMLGAMGLLGPAGLVFSRRRRS